jgi:uncharacterized Zn-binding protein involved in type VI secretion
MKNDHRWLMGLTLLAFVCTGHPALAAPGSPPQLVIVSARADLAAGILTIDGDSFGDGQPVVTLNGMLVIESATASEIMADLPPGLAPGTYLLTVSRGPATLRSSASTEIQSGANTTIRSGASTEIQSGGSTNIEGAPVFLNGGGQPAARAGDTVQVNPASGTGSIVTGSTTVFIGN